MRLVHQLALLLFFIGFAQIHDVHAARPPVTKLAVLINYASPDAVTAEDLVGILGPNSSDPRAAAFLKRFQNPSMARLLITNRLPKKFRDTLAPDHPDELLHRYVVLEFPNEPAALAAKDVLGRDPMVLFVEESMYADFSATPSDPFYATQSFVQDYQWGINDALSLQSAWNSVRGTAFLAHLDNGIQSNPLHPDLGQPFRRFNFNVDGTTNVSEDPAASGVGHGTATAGVMAATTSQASVPSGYPNPTSTGVAGVCWFCNLMIAKISRTINGVPSIDSTNDVPNALNWAVNSGAQVVNMSFGGADHACASNPNDPFCLALQSAAAKDVIIVAAAGNSDIYSGGGGTGIGTDLQLPAKDSRTIAVGAIQSYNGTRGNLWTEESPVSGFVGSSGGPGMTTRGILAPGRDILSTFFSGMNWNAPLRCGTSATFPGGARGTSHGPDYGICTGTSLATPHITGAVGLLRSINPILSATQIRTDLLQSGDNAGSPNNTRGFGVPNMGTAVSAVLSTTNRLMPLFSGYSSNAWDYFYSVVPQQARAALTGQLLPFPIGGTSPNYYAQVGTPIAGYNDYPDTIYRPEAEVFVFTTFVNPKNPSVELMPLYRLSWRCGDGATSVCPSNPNHVSHFYTADLSEAQAYIGGGFSFDAIEGYVYPVSQPQPSGTVALMRAYSSAVDGYAMFPQDLQSTYAANGYTLLLTTVGYVYRNLGAFPTY